MVQLLKFDNGEIISSHIYDLCNYLSMLEYANKWMFLYGFIKGKN